MKYATANKNYRMFTASLAAVVLIGVGVLGAVLYRAVMGRHVPNGAWLVLALATVGAVLLLWQAARWYNEREDIRAAWWQRVNNIDAFLFLVHGPLKAEGVRVIRHLWRHDSAPHTSMHWSEEKLDEAAATYPGGPKQFLRQLLSLQIKGYIEFSQKNYHRLSIGENLWDVVRAKCRLEDFSAETDDRESIEEARQKLDTLCGS